MNLNVLELFSIPPWLPQYSGSSIPTTYHCEGLHCNDVIVFTLAIHDFQNGGSQLSPFHTKKLIELVPVHVLFRNFSGPRTRMILFILFVLLLCIGDSRTVLENRQNGVGGRFKCLDGTLLTFVSYTAVENASLRFQIVPLPERPDSVYEWRPLQILRPTTSIPVCVETSPEDTYTLRVISLSISLSLSV